MYKFNENITLGEYIKNCLILLRLKKESLFKTAPAWSQAS